MNASPTVSPKKPATFGTGNLVDFGDAIRAITKGYKISKLEWDDPNIYGILHEGHLRIKLRDEELHDWIITDGDLFGTDWVILP